MPDKVYTGAAIKVEIGGVQVSIAVSHPPTPSQAVFSIQVEDQPKKAHGLGAPDPESPVRAACPMGGTFGRPKHHGIGDKPDECRYCRAHAS